MNHDDTLRWRLQPVARHSGFRMDGYYVWCASAIKVGATYHLFAARWPVATGFPDGQYHVLCEDNEGGVTGHTRWGARLVSPDGTTALQAYEPEPVGYDHTIQWADGGSFTAQRRERPWLLCEDDRAVCLLTGVYDCVNTWSQPVAIAPAWPVGCA
jgi:hypothetical protein